MVINGMRLPYNHEIALSTDRSIILGNHVDAKFIGPESRTSYTRAPKYKD
jgi:hypothetical protein